MQVDLGRTYKITEVVLAWQRASAKTYQIQVSGNAANWTTIYRTKISRARVTDLTGMSGTGRYVRMNASAHGVDWTYALRRLSVYGIATKPGPWLSGGGAWPALRHVPTWAYDDGCNGGSGASAALVRQWVSYAESNCGPRATKGLGDCHAGGVTYCTVLAYLDTNRIYSDSVPIAASASESWWLHQPGYPDSAHRLSVPDYGGGYLLNQTSSGVDTWFAAYVRTNFNAWDGLMMDDTGGGLVTQLWGTGFRSSQEITSDGAVLSAHMQMARSLSHANGAPLLQVDNGIGVNPYVATTFPLLGHPGNVSGLVAEGDPISNGTVVTFYPTLLDEMAYVDRTAAEFMVLLSYDPSGSSQARRMQAASVLLGYFPGHTVSWSDLETNSGNLAVWPEEGIVPTHPIESMSGPGGTHCLDGTGSYCTSGGHNDLQVTPGVYRREFAACYNQGAPFGRCAAIVNTTGSPITVAKSWLTSPYQHQIALNGGDVQSGGTVNLTGTTFQPGHSTIAAHDATLVTP